MNRRKRTAGHFKYGASLKQRNYGKLKNDTKAHRKQQGADGWQQGWKGSDLRVLKKTVTFDTHGASSEGDCEAAYTVKLPPYIKTSGQAKDYLSGVFHKGCNCSHDCCGHFFSSVWTHTFRRTKRNEYRIRVSYQRNV